MYVKQAFGCFPNRSSKIVIASVFSGTPLGVPFLVWLSQAVRRDKSTRFHSKLVISLARQPVDNANLTNAAKWGGQTEINLSASSFDSQRSLSTSPDNSRILECYLTIAIRLLLS